MKRIFLFIVPSLDYEKKDLNVFYSENRIYIGQLSRMITNSIFLSHSLRDEIIIRILVSQPVTHLIEIKSETIRYLGPDERSSASLLNKVENFVRENFSPQGFNSFNKWFEPNPGIKVKKTDNIFSDLDCINEDNVSLIQVINCKTGSNNNSLNNFSNQIKESTGKNSIFILQIDFNQFIQNMNSSQKNTLEIPNNNWRFQAINSPLNYDIAKIIDLTNLILDELEEKS